MDDLASKQPKKLEELKALFLAQAEENKVLPISFTASETFDVGLDTCSPVADDYFEKAPFKFEGTLKRLYFKNL